MSTFNEASETQPAGRTGEYFIRQDLMQIKREGQTQFDREQAAFLGRIEQHRQSVEHELRADMPAGLQSSAYEAHQALLAARRQAAQARQALATHDADRGRVAADDVPTRARRRGELANELIEYEAIAANADAAYQAAQERVQQALQQAFIKRRTAAQTALDRRAAEFDREILAAQAALDQVWVDRKRELEALAEHVNFYDRYQG